jgi:SAM-dependent methyltransferase
MNPIRLFTIAYRPEHVAQLEPGFEYLDNLANERPDWREYWPIRRFLLSQPLDDSTWYGFFSPRLREKTGLSAADLRALVNAAPAGTDVVAASPQPDIGALFPNVFVGGELFDPGYLDTFRQCTRLADLDVDPRSLVTEQARTIFSNFFIAKPGLWRRWLAITEAIFQEAERRPHSELSKALDAPTPYGQDARRKVFVIEGVVSLLLTIDPSLRVHTANPFRAAWSAHFADRRDEIISLAALKSAWKQEGHADYGALYERLRSKVLREWLAASAVSRAGPYPDSTAPSSAPPTVPASPAPSSASPTAPAPPAPTTAQPNGSAVNRGPQTPAHDLYNPTILELLPAQARRVVEVGCMLGSLARVYRERNPHCHWIGIDVDAHYVQAAREHCAQAFQADVELLSESEWASLADADAWIFGDTLEHLREPWTVLKKIAPRLAPGGVVIASIPNAQHWSFQARVNAGQFRYEDEGLFDRTHLRFFTRQTILEMFSECGYRITNMLARNLTNADEARYMPSIRVMAQASGVNPDVAERDARAFQFVVVAQAA